MLAAQGWTDPIFAADRGGPDVQARCASIRRGYPVELYFGDFEHLTAQIKIPDMRYYHRLGNRLLDHYLRGKKRRPRFDVRSAPTLCDPEAFGPVRARDELGRARTPTLTFDLPGPQMTARRSPTRGRRRHRPRRRSGCSGAAA